MSYCCFISYRSEASNIAKDIYKDLSGELGLHLEAADRKIFMDEVDLRGGILFNKELAKALCESVCMIAVLTPLYFSKERIYCAREYRAMEQLEKRRLKALVRNSNRGFIIPIVLHDLADVPNQISQNRDLYNFRKFSRGERGLSRRSESYNKHITKIAEYICERHKALEKSGWAAVRDCLHFRLPTEKETVRWLDKL